jgi:hypothetical protein
LYRVPLYTGSYGGTADYGIKGKSKKMAYSKPHPNVFSTWAAQLHSDLQCDSRKADWFFQTLISQYSEEFDTYAVAEVSNRLPPCFISRSMYIEVLLTTGSPFAE